MDECPDCSWSTDKRKGRPVLKTQLAKLRDAIRRRRLSRMTPDQVFARIYGRNSWGDSESRSGKGSNMAVTTQLRAELPDLMRRHGITSMLDIPCGDFNWMKSVDLQDVDYIGADIVPDLIEGNRTHEIEKRRFLVLDLITSPLPGTDLVFTRDCIVHLSTEHALRAIGNIRASGAKFLMATTFPETGTNIDILTGQWRSIDMTRPPFSFPDPIEMIHERPPAGKRSYPDKAMGLWRVDTLPHN
jgi:hypothetical protein